MPKRVYSEQEVAGLIRRAVELEAERSKQGGSEDQRGLTMQDLEKIAADSGIDPELMRRAADELQHNMSPQDIEDTTTVNRTEIVAEHWIKGDVTSRILDNLIIELNQRFGTSQDEISWWNTMFNDYTGKALVNKTATSADWKYTDEFGMYTTRALVQQRGDKLRIRVSKRQAMNLSWNSGGLNIILAAISFILLTSFGTLLGFTGLDSPILGISAGLGMSALFIPALFYFMKKSLNRHKQGVTKIAENLVIQAKQMLKESGYRAGENNRTNSSDMGAIELDSDDQQSYQKNAGTSEGLRNHLRE